MKLILAFALLTFCTVAMADAVSDHAKALYRANKQFNADTKACTAVKDEADRNKCNGTAKAKHTKAVEKADAAAKK